MQIITSSIPTWRLSQVLINAILISSHLPTVVVGRISPIAQTLWWHFIADRWVPIPASAIRRCWTGTRPLLPSDRLCYINLLWRNEKRSLALVQGYLTKSQKLWGLSQRWSLLFWKWRRTSPLAISRKGKPAYAKALGWCIPFTTNSGQLHQLVLFPKNS